MAAVWLCGCFQVQDDLTLEADGSGKVTLSLHSSLSEEVVGILVMSSPYGSGSARMYPPVNEAEARRFFPPRDFELKVEEREAGEGKTLVVEASFKDINRLLASPYGRVHQLALATNQNGTLRLRARSGGETLAMAAQMKPAGAMDMLQLPEMEDAQKKKGEMRFEFQVTLPNTVTAANGARENKTVTWGAERAKCKDDDEFASKLSGVLEASCSAGGLKFSPVTPPRLGLVPFGEPTAGKMADGRALPDTNQIVKAARFVPYALLMTRSLDLSEEGGGGAGVAQLSGAIVLPADLAPQQWGEAKLEEVVDGKGNSLMPKEDRDAVSRMRGFSGFGMRGDTDEEDDADAANRKDTGEKEHTVTLSFRAPEWKAKEIARVKGVLELEYSGGAEVIKLSNAVPSSLVVEVSGQSSYSFNSDSEHRQITDSRLAEVGLSLRVETAMVQNGMTVLSLQTSGGKTALMDAQVFDVAGRPWPTTLLQPDSSGGEERSCQAIVAGKPKPPFSLALTVIRVVASVEVPILLTAELGGIRLDEPLESRRLVHVAKRQAKTEPDLPITDAGPGFRAEPVGLTISMAHYFPEGKEHFKNGPQASMFEMESPGTVISAKLFPPKGRQIRSVTGLRVKAGEDDKGRAISTGAEGSDAGESYRTFSYDSKEQEKSGAARVQLHLGLPAPDAQTIEQIEAEAVVLTIGGWKEMLLTNVQADAKKEIDLGEVLSGAKLIVKRIRGGRRQTIVEARLEGPAAVNQLELQIKSSSRRAGSSNTTNQRTTTSGKLTTRNLTLHSYGFERGQGGEKGKTSPPTLLVRYPRDMKRERLQFKLTTLRLL